MASMVPLPPWLNIDPTAPVGRLLQGYQSGLSAAEAQSNAAARAQQQALAEQQAAELNAYRQQQQALDAQQFNQRFELEKEKAQREATIAAQQMRGLAGAKSMLEAGEEWPKILATWGPDLFAGNPHGFALGMQGLQKMEPAKPAVYETSPEGVPFYRDPTSGKITFIPAAALKAMAPGGGTTTAVTSKLQTSLLQGEKAVELGKELWEKLSPEALGVQGVKNRVVINEGLAQLFPSLYKGDIADAQALLGNFNEKAVAAITAAGDKRVSNADMARYQRMLPKISVGESLDSARTKIKTFTDELRSEAVKDAQRLGVPRPIWTLSKEEIRALYKAGKIDRETAAAAIEKYYPIER